MINLLCKTDFSIGTMGQLMTIIENIEEKIVSLDDIEYIEVFNTFKAIKANPFDYLFQKNQIDKEFTTIQITPHGPHKEKIPEDKLIRYKIIKSKFILYDEIINRFNNIKSELGVNETFLGVHVRLTDMNAVHGQNYGNTYFEDFVQMIDTAMATNQYSKIYVASDSQDAIPKLKTIYGDSMVSYNDFIRLKDENGDLSSFIAINLPTNKKWIQDTFIEMLLLAECGGLIHRVSNFANVVKVYSNTIKNTYFLTRMPQSRQNTSRLDSKSVDFETYVENGIIKARRKYRNG